MVKYILVTGGVISGIGKGVFSSSVGALLKANNIRVTSIKIDPYVNIDAGTFSPYEHGEVYVLDDGGEVDLDLGNYERFLGVKLTRDNNITTGKIYQSVINKERRGDYLGKTVQVVPHITDEIQNWVERVGHVCTDDSGLEPEVCIIELGGTVGDIEGMPFVEAFRQFQFRVDRDSFCNIHVSLMPNIHGEDKTKPTQASVRELRRSGLSPDVVVCRSQGAVSDAVKAKIAMFCHVKANEVLILPDCSSIFKVPSLLHEEGFVDYLRQRLNLDVRPSNVELRKWKKLGERQDRLLKSVKIGLVGKYCKLADAYTSVIKALQHSCMYTNLNLDLMLIDSGDLEDQTKIDNPIQYYEAWKKLCSVQGVLVPGGFGTRGTDGKICAINWARTSNIPTLGICYGMQLMVIELARNVLKWKDANSSEIEPNAEKTVVIEMPEHNGGDLGGTMRLGRRETVFEDGSSTIKTLYGNKCSIFERHRHRYEVNPDHVETLEANKLRFIGKDTEGVRMEICELGDHPYFVGVQFHPEYQSRPMQPSPPYTGLILASAGKLKTFISRDCRMSPMTSSLDDEISPSCLSSDDSSDGLYEGIATV